MVALFDARKVAAMNFLPDDVSTLIGAYYTCEVTTVNTRGQPVTWPCLSYFHPESGQIIMTASIAFRVKALNARRHPKISLLYSNPEGSGLTNPPAVLIQGDATVEELLDHTDPKIINLYRVIQQRQPDNENFTRNRFLRSIFNWYLFQRLLITVMPRCVHIWDCGNFHEEPREIEVAHVE
jgi:hypothetical protein